MARARALMAAVPQRAWLGVACLVLLASLGLGTVLGAGLSAWRGAVGTPSAAPRVVIPPPASAIVVVPTPHHASVPPASPARPAQVVAPASPAAVGRVAARPVVPRRHVPPPPPAHPPTVHPPTVQPPAPTPAPPPSSGPVAAPVPAPGPRVVRHHHDNGRHLGWVKGRRGAPAKRAGHGPDAAAGNRPEPAADPGLADEHAGRGSAGRGPEADSRGGRGNHDSRGDHGRSARG